jgi:hypothetical protein
MAQDCTKTLPRQSQSTRTRSFFKNFQQQVEQILETREPEDRRPVLLMAADEGRFGRLGEVRACCVRLGLDQWLLNNK